MKCPLVWKDENLDFLIINNTFIQLSASKTSQQTLNTLVLLTRLKYACKNFLIVKVLLSALLSRSPSSVLVNPLKIWILFETLHRVT